MQPPSRCRIPKNVPRAALRRTRGSYWENSASSGPLEAVHGVRSCNQGCQAPRALSLSAQPRQICAACQRDGCDPEARGRGQCQAEQGCPHVTLLMIAGGSATGLSATGACIIHVLWSVMAGGCALFVELSREGRPLSAITSGGCTPCENRVPSRYSGLALFCRAPRGVPLS